LVPAIVTDVPTSPEVGLNVVIVGAEEAAFPVPVNATANGAAVILFVTLIAPVRGPPVVGVNVMLIVQLRLIASGAAETQLSVSEKSPVAATAVIVKPEFSLTFVRLNVCDPLVVQMF